MWHNKNYLHQSSDAFTDETSARQCFRNWLRLNCNADLPLFRRRPIVIHSAPRRSYITMRNTRLQDAILSIIRRLYFLVYSRRRTDQLGSAYCDWRDFDRIAQNNGLRAQLNRACVCDRNGALAAKAKQATVGSQSDNTTGQFKTAWVQGQLQTAIRRDTEAKRIGHQGLAETV